MKACQEGGKQSTIYNLSVGTSQCKSTGVMTEGLINFLLGLVTDLQQDIPMKLTMIVAEVDSLSYHINHTLDIPFYKQ